MDSWTPQAVLQLLLGLKDVGTVILAAAGLLVGWYFACRYGLPWRPKK